MIAILGQRVRIKLDCAREEGDGLFAILHADYRWRKTRNAHLKRESCCQMCGLKRTLEVHHIRPWHIAEDLRYEASNLVTLCRECHFRFGHYLNWRDCNMRIRELCKYAQSLRVKGEQHEDESMATGGTDPYTGISRINGGPWRIDF